MEIEKVSNFNFLGVILDECFTWRPHIDKLAIKLSTNAGILNKLKNLLPSFIMKTLYLSLSHSHLNYGILIWRYKCIRLVKLQKRLIRIVMLAKYTAHTDPLFKQAAILKISDMFRINALKFYYKHQHRKLSNYFYNFNLTTQGSHHSYDTRSIEQIRTDRTRAEFGDNRIRIFLPKVINSTPANLLQKIGTHSLQGFSSNIKGYILDEYTEICFVTNCYICQRTRKNDVQPFSTGFLHAKLTSVSKCSITLSPCYCCTFVLLWHYLYSSQAWRRHIHYLIYEDFLARGGCLRRGWVTASHRILRDAKFYFSLPEMPASGSKVQLVVSVTAAL